MICGTCEQKINIVCKENEQTIWSFNPFIYESYHGLKNGFNFFYKKIEDKSGFYRVWNEEGYTYSQWYIYYLSSNMYKYKKLHTKIVWFFQVISRYIFFKEFIKLGKREDPRHNTLHHFLKYMTNMGKLQILILNLLIENGLKMEDEDADGNNGFDYLNQGLLSDEDVLAKNMLTKKYKILEKDFDNIVLENIKDKMKKCEICNEFIEKYEDFKTLKEFILQIEEKGEEKNIKNMILSIIDCRQKCIDIYKKYMMNDTRIDSIERHQYVVDIYKEIIKNDILNLNDNHI